MRVLTVTGHVVANAEKKVSQAGREYVSFRIGSNEFSDKKDENGNVKTYWFNVISTAHSSFALLPYLTKGKSVIVTGDYTDHIYQNNQGVCDISRNIIANSIYFNSDPSSNQNNNGQQRVATPQATASPVVQTTMTPPVAKPTTAQIQAAAPSNDIDDLPF